MTTRAEFDRLLDACLDERRDPCADPAVVRCLEQHPEWLDGFARLTDDLRRVHDARPSARAPRRVRPHVASIAAAALLVAAMLPFAVRAFAPATQSAPPPPTPRIVAAELWESPAHDGHSTSWTVRTPLVQTTTSTIETYELHHELHR
jgi:hypothetical protein